jgi:hypothetical protein
MMNDKALRRSFNSGCFLVSRFRMFSGRQPLAALQHDPISYSSATQRGTRRLPRPTPQEKGTVMAQVAKSNEAEKAADNLAAISSRTADKAADNLAAISSRTGNGVDVAAFGRRAADKGADAAREAIERTQDAARRGFQAAQRTAGAALEAERAVARRSTEGATEVGQAFAELVKEQARANVEAFRALAGAFDWNRPPASRPTCCAPASSGRRRSPGATSRWCRR